VDRAEIAIFAGVLSAMGLVLVGRWLAHREMLIYGVGLGFAALISVGFGLQGGAPTPRSPRLHRATGLLPDKLASSHRPLGGGRSRPGSLAR
jgi:hypothetical protein